MLNNLKTLRGGKRFAQRALKSPSTFARVRAFEFVIAADRMLSDLRRQLEAYAAGCVYVGPFRAAPERFYRLQELSVSRLEPHGENLAMFLRSLSQREIEDFSAFAAEHVGFKIRLQADGSHVTILLEDEREQAYNLIDMGYGFSQVLPVVAQCWSAASGRRTVDREPLPTVIAIEQPELHLHPHYQAKLADMFVGTIAAARAVRSSVKRLPRESVLEAPHLIVETHSEPLIARLGELVESGKLASEDVVVLLFEQDPATKVTTIKQSTFASDGTLTNWPIGFFAP